MRALPKDSDRSVPKERRQRRVLLVNSASDEREMYAETLRLDGFCTLQARTAADAYRLATELLPELVITDARLDGPEDGLTLTRRLKLDDLTSEIPVVLLTGAILPGQSYLAARLWSDLLVNKPCTPEALLKLVKPLLFDAA